MRTLVLWDVDHTLIDAGGISAELYATAFSRIVGRRIGQMADMAGRTDRAIIADTLRMNGVAPDEDLLLAFADELAAQFATSGERIRRDGRVLPGVATVLTRLAAMPHVAQSVLTGNLRSIAELKLGALGLTGWLDIEIGAYGLEDTDRAVLVHRAQRRAAESYGDRFDRRTTVLVGDTPHDVQAGRDGGARVVAVATGRSGEQELRGAGADAVLPDLADPEAAIDAILDGNRTSR